MNRDVVSGYAVASDGAYIAYRRWVFRHLRRSGPGDHCALEITERVRELDIEIRSGVHTGECELIDGKHGGIGVAIGARISALAPASGVLVSQTVKDLVGGSGLTFKAAGEQELKGVPDRWQIYAVTSRPE